MAATAIHHVALTVNDWDASYPFYSRLAEVFGAKPFIETQGSPHRDDDGRVLILAGDGFMFSIWEASVANRSNTFTDYNVGLHHMAFDAPSRDAVDELYAVLQSMNADIEDPPREYDYVPGYYAVFFRDPDGMRLEYAHVPT